MRKLERTRFGYFEQAIGVVVYEERMEGNE